MTKLKSSDIRFQSSFELMGYITGSIVTDVDMFNRFQSSFELMGYITSL